MIHMPYHSQEEFDPFGYHNDSSLPVLTSMLDWHVPTWQYRSEPMGHSPLLLSERIRLVLGTAALPDFLTPFDMVETLEQYDLPMRYTCSGMQAIRRELDALRPVVALVWYAASRTVRTPVSRARSM